MSNNILVGTSFANDAANNKGGRTGVDPSALDRELLVLAEAESETRRRLAMIQRDDGLLRDASVQLHALSRQVVNLLGGFNLRGVWVPNSYYAVNDVVDFNGSVWVCAEEHNSSAAFNQEKFKRFGFAGGEDAALAAAQAGNFARSALSAREDSVAAKEAAQSLSEKVAALNGETQLEVAAAKSSALAAMRSQSMSEAASLRSQNAAMRAESAAGSQALTNTKTIDNADNAILTGLYVADAGGPKPGACVVKVVVHGESVFQAAECDGSLYLRTVNTSSGQKTPWLSDAVKASDLSSSDAGKGVDLVAGAAKSLPSIADLRLLNNSLLKTVVVSRYKAGGQNVGGGVFVADEADSVTPDNGGTVIVDAAGKRWRRQFVDLSICDFGAAPGASATENDSAISAAAAVGAKLYVPNGIYPATSAAFSHLIKMHGQGVIRIGDTDFPAGNITEDLVVKFPSVIGDIHAIFNYLSARRIDRSATVTVAVDEGVHVINGNGIEPQHPDGLSIRIVGKGGAKSTLKFIGLGSASSKAAIRLTGNYTLGLVDKLTLDGNDWDGHRDGGPTNGGGDPNDPMGVRAREGAVVFCGPDLKIRRFARNGIFAYNNAKIFADHVEVTECGSDSFVASMGSSVRARMAKSISVWGVGFFADYGGSIWCTDGAQAIDGKLRGTSGGQGFSATYGGIIFASGAIAKRNAREGFLSLGATLHCNNATAGGAEGDGNLAGGVAARRGGALFAENMTISHNTGAGCECDDRGYANLAHATITNNTGNGITCTSGGSVYARNIAGIRDNGGFGIFARTGGDIDAQGVSIAAVMSGNASGTISATKDTGTGLARSIAYIND